MEPAVGDVQFFEVVRRDFEEGQRATQENVGHREALQDGIWIPEICALEEHVVQKLQQLQRNVAIFQDGGRLPSWICLGRI